MLRYNDEIIYEIRENWNKRLHSMRIAGMIISIIMIVCGILCLVFPTKTFSTIILIGSIIIMILGIYQILDYVTLPSMMRWSGNLSSGIINIMIGLILLISPKQLTINVLVYIFGFILLFYGINKITFAHQLAFFNTEGYSWVIFTGIMAIIVAAIFLILPMFVSIILSYILAIYLIVEGVVQLVEVMKMYDLIV